MLTPAAKLKRKELQLFIERVLAPDLVVQGVVGIGSLATGQVRAGSDIDIVVFLEPMDWHVIPAEFIWRPSDGTFHSIFTRDPLVLREGISIDAMRVDMARYADSRFHWPEELRSELGDGWIAFDRTGEVARLIARRTAYSENLRRARLDEALIWLDQHLESGQAEQRWRDLGPLEAHDRLQAALQQLVHALFAYNRHYLPWRDRQTRPLLGLDWLPRDFEQRALTAACAPGLDHDGYMQRVTVLRSLFEELLQQVLEAGLYRESPVDEAFIRSHDEPGYAWNMDEWNAARLRRKLSR
jgi:hypothetical protein